MFFFLPFTCFSKLLSLWLITAEEEDIFLFGSFGVSTGNELWPFAVDAACFNADNMEKEDCGEPVGFGAAGKSGIPKVCFTPGTLSAAKLETKEHIRIRKIQENRNTRVHQVVLKRSCCTKPYKH